MSAPAPAAPPLLAGDAVAAVQQLAAELTNELTAAANVNAQLRADLDRAMSELARTAGDARTRDAELMRLSTALAERSELSAKLAAEVRLAEEERDGALAQLAQGGVMLRAVREDAEAAKAAAREARAAEASARQLAAEREREAVARAAERDEARAAATAARDEKERLAASLAAATTENAQLSSARGALEEVHKALSEARARAQKLGGR